LVTFVRSGAQLRRIVSFALDISVSLAVLAPYATCNTNILSMGLWARSIFYSGYASLVSFALIDSADGYALNRVCVGRGVSHAVGPLIKTVYEASAR